MDGQGDFTITRLGAWLSPQAGRQNHDPELHHPPAPSSKDEGELALRHDLAPPLGPAPSTAVSAVPLPAGGEDLCGFEPLREPSASRPSTAHLREPPAKPRRAAAPRREPPPQPLRVSAPPREPRHDLFSPERQAQFLSALSEVGSVRTACARVGVSAQTAYLHRRRSARFAAAWDGALVLARQVAEDVLAFRALEGVEEPVFYRGEQVGSRFKFDARLLLAHLARLDAHIAASPHALRRAARFDELLALVAGAEPPEALVPSGDPDLDAPKPRAGRWDAPPADPQLPPERADFIDAALDDLPGRPSKTRLDHCATAAHEAWSDWRAAAEVWADRVTGPAAPAAQAVVAAVEPVAAPVAEPPAPARRAGRDTLLRTLSGVSTSALGSAQQGAFSTVPPSG